MTVYLTLINTVAFGDKAELMKNAVEILKLAGMYFSTKDYTLITDCVPYDDLYYFQNEMLEPSQPAIDEQLLCLFLSAPYPFLPQEKNA